MGLGIGFGFDRGIGISTRGGGGAAAEPPAEETVYMLDADGNRVKDAQGNDIILPH